MTTITPEAITDGTAATKRRAVPVTPGGRAPRVVDASIEEGLADLRRTMDTARETGRVLRRHWVPIGLNFAVMFLLALAYLAGQSSGQGVSIGTGLMIALAGIALSASGGGLVACGCFAVSRAKAAIKARRRH